MLMWRAEGTWTSWERKSEEERSNPEATSSSCHANEAFLQELDWSNLYLDISDGSEVLRDLEFFLLVPLQPSNNHHGGSTQTVAGASVGVADVALEVDVASSSLRDRPHNEHNMGFVKTDKRQRANQVKPVVNSSDSDKPLSIAESGRTDSRPNDHFKLE